jgi:large subunit ribosomal protein L17
MRHGYFGSNLSRSTDEKKRLMYGLMRDLILHERIRTTAAKAKAIQPTVDKLITRAKQGTEASYRRLLSDLPHADAVKKLVADSKDRFSGRTSGYTRIVRIGRRQGDDAYEVILSFVDEVKAVEVVAPAKKEEKAAPAKKAVAPKAEEPKTKAPARRKTVKSEK